MADEGSRPLKDARHEAFAQACLSMNQRDAYLKVFPMSRRWKKANAVDSKASTLAAKLRQRIEALQAKREEKAINSSIATREELAEIMTQIARTKLGEHIDEHGNIRLDNLHTSAVEAIEVDPETGRRKIKLRDPIRAAERLAKLLGYDAIPDAPPPPTPIQIGVTILDQLSVAELRKLLALAPAAETVMLPTTPRRIKDEG